ncbi:hypothetical protein SDC9_74314 [bioreactor metagenome]|uniref:Uncharacterized protein n=1 Tax=bioreactor metagenome TaxID=1076179 RepID=A0A644YH69_9ZZZZ
MPLHINVHIEIAGCDRTRRISDVLQWACDGAGQHVGEKSCHNDGEGDDIGEGSRLRKEHARDGGSVAG